MSGKLRIAVITEKHKNYVLDMFRRYPDCGIEIACFADYITKHGSCDGIPTIELDDIRRGYGYDYEAVLVVISKNNDLSRLLFKLHEQKIYNIYLIRLFTLDRHSDFLTNSGFYLDSVDKINNEKPYLVHLETHICDHCNLNCKACNNFSPFVRERSCASSLQYEIDLRRLSELFFNIGRLFLLGGEPLLEPDLACKFIGISRTFFPNSELRLLTNGLLILMMSDDFWTCIKDNKVILHISVYPPTQSSLEQIEALLNDKGISYHIERKVESFVKPWTLYPFEDDVYNNDVCGSAGCHYLSDGKISKCPDAILIDNLDKEFGSNLKSRDIIDINGPIDPWQLIEALNNPIDLCKHCSFKRLERVPWAQTEKTLNISDWIIEHRFEYENRMQAQELVKLNLKLIDENEKLQEKEFSLKSASNKISIMDISLQNANTKLFMTEQSLDNAKKRLVNVSSDLEKTEKRFSDTSNQLKNIQQELLEIQGDYSNILNSHSFRIGRLLTWFPRRLMGLFCCFQEHGMMYTLKVYYGKLCKSIWNTLKKKSILTIGDRYTRDIKRGYLNYSLLIRKYGAECKIYVQYYGGTGDVYIDSAFLKRYMEQSEVQKDRYVFVVTGQNAYNVTQLFDIDHVEVLGKEDIMSLLHFARFYKSIVPNLEFLHYYDGHMYTAVPFYMAGHRNINFADLYMYYVFKDLSKKDMEKPRFSSNTKSIDEMFEQMELIEGKTVLLAPYAISLRSPTLHFWGKLAEALKGKGYCVCTNVFGDKEKPIKGTVPISLGYTDIGQFLLKGRYFIGARSGLCEIISTNDCKKIILYPEEVWPQKGGISSSKTVFSLNLMEYCNDAIELEFGRDETGLLEEILKEI